MASLNCSLMDGACLWLSTTHCFSGIVSPSCLLGISCLSCDLHFFDRYCWVWSLSHVVGTSIELNFSESFALGLLLFEYFLWLLSNLGWQLSLVVKFLGSTSIPLLVATSSSYTWTFQWIDILSTPASPIGTFCIIGNILNWYWIYQIRPSNS